jgi:hypothetical protein
VTRRAALGGPRERDDGGAGFRGAGTHPKAPELANIRAWNRIGVIAVFERSTELGFGRHGAARPGSARPEALVAELKVREREAERALRQPILRTVLEEEVPFESARSAGQAQRDSDCGRRSRPIRRAGPVGIRPRHFGCWRRKCSAPGCSAGWCSESRLVDRERAPGWYARARCETCYRSEGQTHEGAPFHKLTSRL